MWGGWAPEVPEGLNSGVESEEVVSTAPHRALTVIDALALVRRAPKWDRVYDLAADARQLAWNESSFAAAFERALP